MSTIGAPPVSAMATVASHATLDQMLATTHRSLEGHRLKIDTRERVLLGRPGPNPIGRERPSSPSPSGKGIGNSAL
jgi:hypothetical protein